MKNKINLRHTKRDLYLQSKDSHLIVKKEFSNFSGKVPLRAGLQERSDRLALPWRAPLHIHQMRGGASFQIPFASEALKPFGSFTSQTATSNFPKHELEKIIFSPLQNSKKINYISRQKCVITLSAEGSFGGEEVVHLDDDLSRRSACHGSLQGFPGLFELEHRVHKNRELSLLHQRHEVCRE